jgi:hypothetical protein
VAGQDNDEIERWLNEEFETPAQESIKRAISGDRLTREDWHQIIRFVAAQDMRTPARLHEMMKRWSNSLQPAVEQVLEESVRALKSAKETGVPLNSEPHPYGQYFPIKVTTELPPGADSGTLKVQTVAGRGLWLFGLKQLLTETLQVLHKHKWTVLVSPEGETWMTSDDPVVKLNYESEEKYNFGGGWGRPGTEIFMPLGPRHLLYTRVSFRPPPRGTVMSAKFARSLQSFTVEHAHRFVFSTEPDARLPAMRERHVSAEQYAAEAKQWANWHQEQTDAESNLLKSS